MSAVPVCDFDFYGDAVIADPLPCYRDMLERGPVVWLARNAMLAIPRFQDVTAMLRATDLFSSGHGVSINDDVNARLVGSTLNSDPPEHDESRAITGAPLLPRALATLQPKIAAAADEFVDMLVRRGGFDAASELAPYLPLTIVRDLVGLSEDGRDRMLEWGAATFELMGDARGRRDAAFHDLSELRRYLEQNATRDRLAPDGWARRIFDVGEARGIVPERCAEMMRDYIAPSLDTTISVTGYAILLFARHPEQWERLRADPSLVGSAIEEVVRLNTPIRAFSRYVTRDTEFAGVEMRQGSRVQVVYGAANRDPRRFAEPDRFDIGRDSRGHVGFGHGVHTCMGMHLARLEITCLLQALLQRVARFELAGEPRTVLNSTIHAYASVPVRVH